MRWKWNSSRIPIHEYCRYLWESNYKRVSALICDGFLVPLFTLIFQKECPRISEEEKNTLKCIGNWYLQEKCTYLGIYGAMESPHLVPKYMPN